jgi:hypothetical protein
MKPCGTDRAVGEGQGVNVPVWAGVGTIVIGGAILLFGGKNALGAAPGFNCRRRAQGKAPTTSVCLRAVFHRMPLGLRGSAFLWQISSAPAIS